MPGRIGCCTISMIITCILLHMPASLLGKYGRTELETSAMVWTLSHFLYISIVVYTYHTAVKGILGNPQLSGKHAQWWTKVYNQGIKELKILHWQENWISEQIHCHINSHNPLELVTSLKNLTCKWVLWILQWILPPYCRQRHWTWYHALTTGKETNERPQLNEIILLIENGERQSHL